MTILKPHKQNSPSNRKVKIDYDIVGKKVLVQFDVQTPQVNVSDRFSKFGYDNQGLWDFDVVEVFIQKKCATNHYLELQCSPIGQKFALIVIKPREETAKVEKLGSVFTHCETKEGFSVQFEIAVSDIPGDGSDIYANFFACLGPINDRSYFGLNINTEDRADFHRPELFTKIGSI